MKRISLLTSALLICGFATLSAQSTQTRTLSVDGSYSAIDLAGTQILNFDIGPAGEPLTIIGTADDLDNMQIYVENGTLTIRNKKGYRSKSRKAVQIFAKNPTLHTAKVSGTGTINITGKLDEGENNFSVSGTGTVNIESVDCRKLICSVSGTGSVRCPQVTAEEITAGVGGTGNVSLSNITAQRVDGRSSGTGNVILSGTTVSARYSSSGTGNVNAGELRATDVNASASGTGNVYCYCSGNFNANASGIGKIHLYGDPVKVTYTGSDKRLVKR